MTLEGVNTPLSGNASIDGFIWQEHPTYAVEMPFKNYVNFSFDNALIGNDAARNGSHTMTDTQKANVRAALYYVNQVTGIAFNEIPTGTAANKDLIFATKEMGASNTATGMDVYSYTYTAGSSPVLDLTDSILFNYDRVDCGALGAGTVGYQALLQQIGHALGLKNPSAPPLAVPGLGAGSNLSVMTATQEPLKTAYTGADLAALNWIYGGKGLVNQGKTPSGGSVSGSQTIIDQFSQSGVFVVNS
jgi:hypothetical protein